MGGGGGAFVEGGGRGGGILLLVAQAKTRGVQGQSVLGRFLKRKHPTKTMALSDWLAVEEIGAILVLFVVMKVNNVVSFKPNQIRKPGNFGVGH